jgi:hypothetical protein
MRKQNLILTCTALIWSATSLHSQALRSSPTARTAGVRGHITINEVVGRQAQSTPIARLRLYLLRVDDSRPLVQLQDSCRRAMKDPDQDPLRAYNTCSQGLRQVVELVPTLPAVATTETDRDGSYEFAEVPATGRYYVVGVKSLEGAEPWAMVGLTNKLVAGQRVSLDLSANDPWTQPKTP